MLMKDGFDVFGQMAKSLISNTDLEGKNSMIFNENFNACKMVRKLKENVIFGTNVLGKLAVKKNQISKNYKSIFDCIESIWQPCDLNFD